MPRMLMSAPLSPDPPPVTITPGTSRRASVMFWYWWLSSSSRVMTLIDAGADVNARTKGGDSLKMTPTHWMVYGRHVDGLKALIVGGADVNLLNTEGKTPTDMVLEFMRAERKAAAKRAKETGEEATKENSHEPSTVEILNILAAAGGKTAKQMPDVKAPSKHDEL